MKANNGIHSGGNMSNPKELPEWERVLSAGARFHRLFPEAVMVDGTAAAVYAAHRMSSDADHILTDLRDRFDEVLKNLESVSGWTTARVKRPVLILGSLDGIETGVRQITRAEPLESQEISLGNETIMVPTENEILRIKAVLILKRNATRDYLDFAALADHMGYIKTAEALARFDELYPQPNGASAIQQIMVQLGDPKPYDLDIPALKNYKNLDKKWHDWNNIVSVCADAVTHLFAVQPDKSSPRPKF